MKKIIFLSVLSVFVLIGSIKAQETELKFSDDSTYVDTLNKNLLGLNVFPAFSILGGGRLPSTKVFIQYKHYFNNMNLRASLNYLNFDMNNERLDILGSSRDTLFKDNDTLLVDSLSFRKFYYDVYSYDLRLGLEAAFPNKGYRFYLGSGLILGYHYLGENYYHYKKSYEGYPSLNVNNPIPFSEIAGFRKTRFFKTGLDFTVGVDINITPNFVISVQYAPELVYYHRISDEFSDPDNFFDGKSVSNSLNFVPDYIDLVFNIRF
ncbi:MAG: hypothetical protein GX793_03115 [Bacteroidales bacterium]|jgi:hypothetical protein|nr:hypothetical protein [Bacteroidales bacterium]MDY0314260.1 hypothetical protein [Bacteroidales bacterium]NLB86034.1 hypothetical protein [Bacteroidales bacterium]